MASTYVAASTPRPPRTYFKLLCQVLKCEKKGSTLREESKKVVIRKGWKEWRKELKGKHELLWKEF